MKHLAFAVLLLLSRSLSSGQGISCFDMDPRTPVYSYFAEFYPDGNLKYALIDSIKTNVDSGIVRFYQYSDRLGGADGEWKLINTATTSDFGPFKKSGYLCFNNDIEMYLKNWRKFCAYERSDRLADVPLIDGEESDWVTLHFSYDGKDRLQAAHALTDTDSLISLYFEYEPEIHIRQRFHLAFNDYLPVLDFWYDDHHNLIRQRSYNEMGDHLTKETEFIYDDRQRIMNEKERSSGQLLWEMKYEYAEDGKYIEVLGFQRGVLATKLRYVYF